MSASPDLSRRRTPSATAVLGLCPPSGGGGGGGAGSGGGSSRGGGCGDAGLDGEDAAMKYPARGLCGRWGVPLEDKGRENTKAAANSGEKLAGAAAAQVVWLPPLFPHASLSLSASLALAFGFCFLCLFLVCSFSYALYCVFPVGISFRLEVVDDETEGMRVLFFRSSVVGIPCLCFFFFFFFERPCFRYMPTC